jgi:hypothetical protein
MGGVTYGPGTGMHKVLSSSIDIDIVRGSITTESYHSYISHGPVT